MEYEDFLTQIGGLGPFQRRVGVLLGMDNISCVFQFVVILFIAATPDHLCKLTEPWPNSTRVFPIFNADGKESRYTGNNTAVRSSQCFVDVTTSIRDRNTTKRLPCLEWEYDTTWYDFTIVSQWNLICDREWLVATAGSVFMVGILVGSFIVGIISDRFGRKTPFILSVVIQLVIGIVAAFSPNYTVFVGLRVVNGMVAIGRILTGIVLCMELMGNTGRSIFGFVWMAFMGLSYVLLVGLAYFVREWWKLQLIATIPSAMSLSYYWFVPESPRWLLLNDRKDQARDIMQKMAKANGFKDMDVDIVRIQAQNTKRSATYLDLVRTPTLRIRTLSMMFIWMTISLVYYGLVFSTGNLAGNPYVNHAIAGSMEVISCLVCIGLFEKFGRRFPQFGALLFCGLALLAILAVPKEISAMTIVLTMMGKFTITAAFGMVYVYTTEVFPTVVRNQAVAVGSVSARIGSITAPYIAQLGNNSIIIPSVLFGICAIVSATLMLLIMPETKGIVLADTIQQGEKLGQPQERERRLSSHQSETGQSFQLIDGVKIHDGPPDVMIPLSKISE